MENQWQESNNRPVGGHILPPSHTVRADAEKLSLMDAYGEQISTPQPAKPVLQENTGIIQQRNMPQKQEAKPRQQERQQAQSADADSAKTENTQSAEQNKTNLDILHEVKRHADEGKKTIESLLPKLEEGPLRQVLLEQYERFEQLCAKVSSELTSIGITPKGSSAVKNAVIYSSLNLRSLLDDSPSKIAEMIITANNAAANCMTKTLNAGKGMLSGRGNSLANECLSTMQKHCDELKKFL